MGATQYTIGDVIHHLRYDYRGVVVTVEPNCSASDEWYVKNRTQPRRDQPWYRVLAEGGRETYVAEENIELDMTGGPVEHPLVDRLFPTFYEGRYYQDCFN